MTTPICVLEWCKLFAHRKSVHHWRRVIDDHDRFEADLYATLSVTVDEFAKLITDFKHYRDKFVAHLNEEQIMRPPKLDLPKKSVVFLYGRLVPDAAERLDRDYVQAIGKAQTIYAEALARHRAS